MSISITDAATALLDALPLPAGTPTTGGRPPQGTDLTRAIGATITGPAPAAVALVLTDPAAVPTDPEGEGNIIDALTPAFTAAARAVGGVLAGEPRHLDATDTFAQDEVVVYQLAQGAGWLAVLASPPPTSGPTADPDSFHRIADVPMTLTVQIGHTTMAVREALGLTPNQVVQLDRPAGEPADILLNGRVIARGTVVVIDSDYGVKVTEVFDPAAGN